MTIYSIALIKSAADIRNLGTLALFTGITTLIYKSAFDKRNSPKARGEICMATLWLIVPFIPGMAVIESYVD